MDTNVIITFIVAILIGWIAWLIYNYYTNSAAYILLKEKYIDVCNKYLNLQKSVDNLIKEINKKLPNSNLKYSNDDNEERIEGEIKY